MNVFQELEGNQYCQDFERPREEDSSPSSSVSYEGLPDDPELWPEAWKEEYYTLSGHVHDGTGISWEEADRIAEKELRRRHKAGNYSWQR